VLFQVSELTDERNWRSGLRVRLLLRRQVDIQKLLQCSPVLLVLLCDGYLVGVAPPCGFGGMRSSSVGTCSG
jgi:hypothetical protein